MVGQRPVASPAWPHDSVPPGSTSPSIILHASLWKANGEVKYDTAIFTSPASKFGNSNGTLVPEGEASEGTQGTGSWEKSAISARFFLKCQLRTCVPATVNEVRLPGIWGDRPEASTTGIPDSGAIPSQAASLPGVQATFASPAQSAIRHAAANLSAAISFVQDMEQSMPLQTQGTLAESLRVTSDILREVSEELIAVASNQSSSAAPGSATAADDQTMTQDG